jgi:hypothetical protein
MSSVPEDGQPAYRASSAEDENYYAAIERHFVSLRGAPLFITPREWQLIDTWHERQIPLRVVKDGLDRTFEKRKSTRPVRHLAYCRQAVEAAYRRFCEALAGSDHSVEDGSGEVSTVRLHLGDLERSVVETARNLGTSQPALVQTLEHIAERLGELASNPLHADGFPNLERELGELEMAVVREAETALDEAERRHLQNEGELSLARYRSRMPDDVYRSALQSAYLKRVRGRFGIPALSLFTL